MAKCILHAGMHKTGTTSIQKSLEDLDDAGFYYARILGKSNHSTSVAAAFAREKSLASLAKRLGADAAALQEQGDQARRDLRQSIRKADGRVLVISGEGIITMPKADLERLRRFLERHGYDDIQVAAYVRSPGAYIASAVQQKIKSGHLRNLNLAESLPNYQNKFTKLDTVFGPQTVSLRKFDPALFPHQDAVADFCARSGIQTGNLKLVRSNESLTRMTAKLCLQYAHHRSAEGRAPLSSRLAGLLHELLRDVDQTPFRLSPGLLQPVLEGIQPDIAWMEQRLGQSLAESTAGDRPGDIASEDDLLASIPGIDSQLRKLIAGFGIAFPGSADIGTWDMVDLLISCVEHPESLSAHSFDPDGNAAASGQPGSEGKLIKALLTHMQAGGDETDSVRSVFTLSPKPFLNKDRKLIVLWSPKSACTTAYVWFSHLSGFSDQVRQYHAWPHKHREEVYEKSDLYRASLASDPDQCKVLRIIRDPYARAVSIYRHALLTKFADAEVERYGDGSLSLRDGCSFQQFLDVLLTLDMQRAGIHFRPQFHQVEAGRKPDRIINVSREDLFTALNAFELDMHYPVTDFRQLDWLKQLESQRAAKQAAIDGGHHDHTAFSRRQAKQGVFPGYDQLLTPEARQKIEAIYRIDFDAYRGFI